MIRRAASQESSNHSIVNVKRFKTIQFSYMLRRCFALQMALKKSQQRRIHQVQLCELAPGVVLSQQRLGHVLQAVEFCLRVTGCASLLQHAHV